MKSQNLPRASGFVLAVDEGQPFWFLNTLTITKVGSDQCHGQMSIVDHRIPPGFAPPPHLHHHSDEALLILDGQLDGFCGDHRWQAGPGSLVFMPRAIPHGFAVSDAGPGRIIIVASPGGFDQFVAAAGEPASYLCLPVPVPPDPARLTQLAAATASRSCPARTVTTPGKLPRICPRVRRAVPPELRASAANRRDGLQRSDAVTGRHPTGRRPGLVVLVGACRQISPRCGRCPRRRAGSGLTECRLRCVPVWRRCGLYGICGLRLWYGRGVSAAETAAGGVHGFPAELTSFVGRDE